MSGSGPFGPSFFGVWQSWQAPPITSILPRWIVACAGTAAGGAACWQAVAKVIARHAPRREARWGTMVTTTTLDILEFFDMTSPSGT